MSKSKKPVFAVLDLAIDKDEVLDVLISDANFEEEEEEL